MLRWVCAPHKRADGTGTSPSASFSIRNPAPPPAASWLAMGRHRARVRCGLLLPGYQHAGIDRFAAARDHLKVKLVSGDFHQRESLIGVKSLLRIRRGPQIVWAQLAGVPQHEIIDAILRLQSLITMLVAGHDHVDSALLKNRLQQTAQINIRAMVPAVRIQRMMKETDFPCGA